jgi:hypothetical protein
VSQHPGLANPEISKIIGEQWRNQPAEGKEEWKALAEEEKLRHQQQYPTYRYQPKRNNRRNSLTSEALGSATSDKPRCKKCGGRTILATSTHYTHSQITSPIGSGLPPGTPTSAATPVSRTLPILRDLNLQSTAVRRMRQYNMPSNHHYEERDDVGPLSPDMKRRRFNGEHQGPVQRIMPPCYGAAPPQGVQVGPGTPFPFGQGTPVPFIYPAAQGPPVPQSRRESLPGLRGVVQPPGMMAPPPRSGMGYQQHRLSQGHMASHDRSLTLAPLQTATAMLPATPMTRSSTSKSMEDVIMELAFHHKLKVLRDIAPPAPTKQGTLRGPLITIEGDSVEAATELSKWLVDTLVKDSELKVTLLDSPDLVAKGGREDAMAEYHTLVASWFSKSRSILDQLEYALPTAPPTATTTDMSTSSPAVAQPLRNIDETYSDDDTLSKPGTWTQADKSKSSEIMEIDHTGPSKSAKPIAILPLFSLHASNTFACRIPVTDTYGAKHHWEWSATQWRGIIGPDLTIYVRDCANPVDGKAVEQSEEERLFVVKREKKEDGTWEVDGATLRRLGFEVGEWVRGFGARAA